MSQIVGERMVFFGVPPARIRLGWSEWLRQHGVDPSDVAVPGWIERLHEARQLRWEAFERDAGGRLTFSRPGWELIRVVRVLQLESPPLPWPKASLALAPQILTLDPAGG